MAAYVCLYMNTETLRSERYVWWMYLKCLCVGYDVVVSVPVCALLIIYVILLSCFLCFSVS